MAFHSESVTTWERIQRSRPVENTLYMHLLRTTLFKNALAAVLYLTYSLNIQIKEGDTAVSSDSFLVGKSGPAKGTRRSENTTGPADLTRRTQEPQLRPWGFTAVLHSWEPSQNFSRPKTLLFSITKLSQWAWGLNESTLQPCERKQEILASRKKPLPFY